VQPGVELGERCHEIEARIEMPAREQRAQVRPAAAIERDQQRGVRAVRELRAESGRRPSARAAR
jgi:hypothetical protein